MPDLLGDALAGTPDAWQAQLVQQLSGREKLALFKCSRAAAGTVIRHAYSAKLALTSCQPNEAKTAAARRHHVAMCLAEGIKDLHLVVHNEVLTVVPQCIHAHIGTLELIHMQLDAAILTICSLAQLHTLILTGCNPLQDEDVTCLEKLHVHWPQPSTLIYGEESYTHCLLQAGAVLGSAVTTLRLSTAVTTPELPRVAAKYPNVTNLDFGWRSSPSDDVLQTALQEWKYAQQLAIVFIEPKREIIYNSRSWQRLEYHNPTWSGLAYLPLECFQSVAIHGALCASSRRDAHTRQAFQKLRSCKSLHLVGAMACPCTSMTLQSTFSVHGLSPEEVAQALKVIAQSKSQPPVLHFKECGLVNPVWMAALRNLPEGVTTLVFNWNCYFKKSNEEQYWTQFAASLPAHVREVAVQVETYQQAIAVVTAGAGLQQLTKLWLYLGRATSNCITPSNWWDRLSRLSKQLRPSLKLHLSDLDHYPGIYATCGTSKLHWLRRNTA